MFLSRFIVNPARRGSAKLLSSPQAMHAAVMSSFPPGDVAHSAGRILWRVDRDTHSAALFVVSPSEPDMTHLVEQAGWPTRASWDTRFYEPLLGRLEKGQVWAFRVRANPTRLARDTRKIVGYLDEEQQLAWLSQRAVKNGFRVVDDSTGASSVTVSERAKTQFRRRGDLVTLATARFDGLAEIEDVDLFRSVLVNGLGRAKGYGCGLLTIVRPQLT